MLVPIFAPLLMAASGFRCHVGPYLHAAVYICLWVLVPSWPLSLCLHSWLPLGLGTVSAPIFVPLLTFASGVWCHVGPYLLAAVNVFLWVLVLCWPLSLCQCGWLPLDFGAIVSPYLCADVDICLWVLMLMLALTCVPLQMAACQFWCHCLPLSLCGF